MTVSPQKQMAVGELWQLSKEHTARYPAMDDQGRWGREDVLAGDYVLVLATPDPEEKNIPFIPLPIKLLWLRKQQIIYLSDDQAWPAWKRVK